MQQENVETPASTDSPFENDSDIAICINNTGIEDKFDLGVEYVFEEHKDFQMICVYDKNGIKGEFFRDRFERVRGSSPLKFKEFKQGDTVRIIGTPPKIMKHFK
jgi:hypothetical protein